ncbi:MAG: hypothetical protein IPG45_03420 [Deltaproteobacteria bacterium]|nr:hypothetical protein [Deltaproteobacteria bacterium]
MTRPVGPKGPGLVSPRPLLPKATEVEARPGPQTPDPVRGAHSVVESVGEEEKHRQAYEQLTGGGELGRDGVTPAELKLMGSLVAGRHILTLLARRRNDPDRPGLIKEVADLVMGLEDPPFARRLLLELIDTGRIVDVYPLEILDEVVERRPGYISGVEPGRIILNRVALEAEVHQVEVPIRLEVALGLKMKAFALAGGGSPGYLLSPGPPAVYHLEFGDAGTYTLLLRGDLRKKSYIDRLTLKVVDPGPPDSA